MNLLVLEHVGRRARGGFRVPPRAAAVHQRHEAELLDFDPMLLRTAGGFLSPADEKQRVTGSADLAAGGGADPIGHRRELRWRLAAAKVPSRDRAVADHVRRIEGACLYHAALGGSVLGQGGRPASARRASPEQQTEQVVLHGGSAVLA